MTIRHTTSALLLLLAFALASCTGNGNPSHNQTTEGGATDSIGTVEQAGDGMNHDMHSPNGEADALAILNAINQNEIDAASEARTKKISKGAMDYADMLHKAHTDNYNKTLQLASSKSMTISETNESTEVKTKGIDLLNKLKTLEGSAFETAYLDAMITGHTEALNTIDNKLMPMAASDDVKQHLTETRAHVAMHLEQARQLKAQ